MQLNFVGAFAWVGVGYIAMYCIDAIKTADHHSCKYGGYYFEHCTIFHQVHSTADFTTLYFSPQQHYKSGINRYCQSLNSLHGTSNFQTHVMYA